MYSSSEHTKQATTWLTCKNYHTKQNVKSIYIYHYLYLFIYFKISKYQYLFIFIQVQTFVLLILFIRQHKNNKR